MNFPSTLIEDAVNELSKFPGIGKKSALRMVLYLLKQEENSVTKMGESIIKLRKEIQFCKRCHNVSDLELCNICGNSKRDQQLICVVEDLRDVMAIENTGQFNGTYHILGGLINPIQGIGPEQLKIDSLISRVQEVEAREIIMALSATMEGDTTVFYLSRKLQNSPVKISTISRGIAIGGELEYADEITLGRSIVGRIPYSN
ncbi:MAG: recombination mediator RecR [Bacteroidia bacterium]|nr:recombination mediator RecR [Bacteroidia bacterium]MCF8425648.1 recombination mediator RecR [Bacteroidia bacterium]MCF8446837.1 recombination mediator RecR [Bacteroidia bacterium]